MRALTIKQPWASAIPVLGKDVECRKWSTSYRGLLAIHAGKTINGVAPEELAEALADPPLGAIVAVVTLRDVVRNSTSKWAQPGLYHWELDDIRALSTPVPCRGKQSVWQVPEDVARAVMDALAPTNGTE